MTSPLGMSLRRGGADFAVHAGSAATRVDFCLFDRDGHETSRVPLAPAEDGIWQATMPGVSEGQLYGLRADGPYDPERGLWFDPDRLLMDPRAVEIDRPYRHDPRLTARRGEAGDTASLMPKAVARKAGRPLRAPRLFEPGGLIYEINVRSFTMRHPDVSDDRKGTVAALATPSIVAHLTRLGVSAVELMPVTAWIDERHLPPLGLTNAWGYNPVSFMALDPRLAPGGIRELRETVEVLRRAGIGVILDLVFNHTGESDIHGTTLSLRGLDARGAFRHAPDGGLVNDTGCGHTVACDRAPMRRLILDSLRHFVGQAGVDGFRFDLAPVLARTEEGFDPRAAIFDEIAADPLLNDRIMIAEPWDIGPGGYRLGQFPGNWLEWNDRYRDDVRRFWRGDDHEVPVLATRLAGSSDIFTGDATRSVGFIAAHDGMTLADVTAYSRKHNEANGEDNRDGHGDEVCWNNGAEGATDDPAIGEARRRDAAALLATLFVSRGTIMLTAGDEFGRSQKGNNNAYCQDNEITWLDWAGRDRALEAAAFVLADLRKRYPVLADPAFLTGAGDPPDVAWIRADGELMTEADWHAGDARCLGMILRGGRGERLAVLINGSREELGFTLGRRPGSNWHALFPNDLDMVEEAPHSLTKVAGRAIAILVERTKSIQAGQT